MNAVEEIATDADILDVPATLAAGALLVARPQESVPSFCQTAQFRLRIVIIRMLVRSYWPAFRFFACPSVHRLNE